MLYLVTYDLNKSGKDYSGLTKVLEGYPRNNHFQKSVWLIGTSESAQQLYEKLKPHIDADDRLLVVKWGYEYNAWAENTFSQWITANNY